MVKPHSQLMCLLVFLIFFDSDAFSQNQISMGLGFETKKILPVLLKFEVKHRFDLTNSYYENDGNNDVKMKFSSIDFVIGIGFIK